MNSPRQSIAEWLLIATKDLCEHAKTRVTLEIKTHYQEAVEAHLAVGESQLGAEAMTLEELGDAKAAARRLRRKHLTAKEVKKLSGLMARATKSYSIKRGVVEVSSCACFIWLISALHNHFSTTPQNALKTGCLVLAVSVIFTELWLCRRFGRQLPAHSVIGRIVLIRLVGQAVFIAAYGGAMFSFYDQFMFWVVFGAVSLFPWLRIWLKIRKSDSDVTLNLEKT